MPTRRTAVPAERAADLGCSPLRAAKSLDRLHDHGLVGRLAGVRRRYEAAELSRLYAAAQAGATAEDEAEIVTGPEALGGWFVRLQQGAREDVMTLNRPPYALATFNPVESTALERGRTTARSTPARGAGGRPRTGVPW